MYLLCIFKNDGDIKQLNSFVDLKKWNLDKFPNISVNFEGKIMVDHILEIPRLVVFGVTCLNCNIKKLWLRNNPSWNKDDIEVVI